MRIDPEYWEEWQAHPLTEIMIRYCRVMAKEQEARWHEVSWVGGQIDPVAHGRLQASAQTYQDVATLTREEVEERLNEA